MVLGQVLEQLGDEAFATEALVGMAGLPLAVEVETAASRFGETAAFFAAVAARRFATEASDEDWLGLVAALGRAEDAGAAGLRFMLVWALGRSGG